MTSAEPDLMEKLVSLSKRRGFIFPGSEIYGGLANTWDYGPLGAQLKKNLKDHWWQTFVERRADMVGLDGGILMNPNIWEASGHVATFHDPLVECKVCHKRFRADHLLEAKGAVPSGMHEKPTAEHGAACPECGGELTDAREFNLMFKTFIGAAEDSKEAVYLRPETAQAIFVNFMNVLNTSRKRLPFGIAQIGKAFRNEITPGNFIFRTLEFDQMEVEYFVEESDWERAFEEWAAFAEAWAIAIGIDTQKLHRTEIPADERAHYSKRTVDFEFEYPFGRKELWGLAYRTDFDLMNHAKHTGERLEYTDPGDQSKKFVPHVVEPSMGLDRTVLAVLLCAYREETLNDGDARVVMRLAPSLAPYKAAVLPLSKKLELTQPARALHAQLLKRFLVEYDETQSIGKRYRRQDEIGTPFCITFD
ncbi:MAG: glycine--tRNA ligase, partial [Patescibacteria group bacterium]